MPESPRPVRHKKASPFQWYGHLLLAAVLVTGAVFAGYRYLHSGDQLPLRVVEVTGEFTYLDHAAIQKRVAEAIQGGFFDVDLLKVRQEVSSMPWVEQVSVRRVWPDTLRMHVTEQVPLAYWNEEGLVNLEGVVFRPEELPELGMLPHLRGEPGSGPRLVAFYLQLHAQLLPLDLRIESVELNSRGEWQVAFRDGLQLFLGRKDIAHRQRVFIERYPQLLGYREQQPERIDLRYQHGFAVRWPESTDGES